MQDKPLTTDRVINLILGDPENRFKVDATESTWQAWRKRLRDGDLSYKKVNDIILSMGYVPVQEHEKVWELGINT